jgi:hypothetical protein
MASAARVRVLKKRAAQSHLSSRTDPVSTVVAGRTRAICTRARSRGERGHWRRDARALGFLALMAGGCRGGDASDALRRADSATFVAIRAESATAVAVSQRAPSGAWDADRVSERLVRSGVAPRRVEPSPEVPGFFRDAIESASFVVGRGGELRVYIFADSAARRRATDALDPRTASPRGAPRAWPLDPVGPTLILNGNLAAVLLGGTSALHERVQLGLEAGLPSQ